MLKFVEEHLDRVIKAWSGLDSFRALVEADAGPREPDHESALLNGPRLAQDAGHVDQSDIDALFDSPAVAPPFPPESPGLTSGS